MSNNQAQSGGERVCAIVVTFNRKVLLAECLRGLLSQRRIPDHILVVNNSSTDGTGEMLANEFPQLEVLELENRGGSGGFRAGIEKAYRENYDWVWVMDDDVEPMPTALETLLQYQDVGHFLHLRRKGPDGPFGWETIWDLSIPCTKSLKRDFAFEANPERRWISVYCGNFEGALIHRDVIHHIGYPDERYFMVGDDIVYGFLATRFTNVLYINEFGFYKKLLPSRKSLPAQLYFFFRNRFLIRRQIGEAGVPLSATVFYTRLILDALYLVREVLLARCPPKALIRVLGGVWDGARGRFGVPGWLKSRT